MMFIGQGVRQFTRYSVSKIRSLQSAFIALRNPVAGHLSWGGWQLDLTHMPRGPTASYFQVLTGTFTVERQGFPCKTEKVSEVIKISLTELIP